MVQITPKVSQPARPAGGPEDSTQANTIDRPAGHSAESAFEANGAASGQSAATGNVAPGAADNPAVDPSSPQNRGYVVKPGDDIDTIAKNHGVTAAAVIAANPKLPGENPWVRSPGEFLMIPPPDGTTAGPQANSQTTTQDANNGAAADVGGPGVSAAPASATYTVKAGDTFSQIAKDLGVSVGKLASANPQVRNLSRIDVDQVLNVPLSNVVAPMRPTTPAPVVEKRDGVIPFSQEDHPDVALGRSKETIGRAGCMLASIAMVSTKLSPTPASDVVDANTRVLNSGGFSGANLISKTAANALGMTQTARNAPASIAAISNELEAGRPVVVGVDFKVGSTSGRSNADHFLVLTRQDQADPSIFHGVDPLGGKAIRFQLDAEGQLRSVDGRHQYRVTESIFHEAR